MLYQFRGIIYCYEVVGAWRAMPIMNHQNSEYGPGRQISRWPVKKIE
jgi:hypothetical protein